MWDEQKRQRFQQLRERENALTEAERGELGGLVKELEAAEAAYLAPATERLRQEGQTLEKRNRAWTCWPVAKKRCCGDSASFLARREPNDTPDRRCGRDHAP